VGNSNCGTPQLSSGPLCRRKNYRTFTVIVSLNDIVEALELATDRIEAYLDVESGKVVLVSEDDEIELKHPDSEGLPEWQREHLQSVRKVLKSKPLLRLPNTSEIHEWSIMETFCNSLTDTIAKPKLLESIHGKGAFQRFRQTLDELGNSEEWFSFRRNSLEQVAREWLDAKKIRYEQ
jgi:hypothetical protein